MQKFRHIYIRKRYRWIIIPLVLVVLGLAYSGRYLDFGWGEDNIDAFHRIKATGQLVALTDRNSLDYFIYNGEPMGYQYELLKSFADYLGVHLKIISSNDISKLNFYLKLNLADMIAMDLPVTGTGKKELHFSQALGESRQILVQRKNTGKKSNHLIKKIEDFDGDTIFIRKNPFVTPLIEREIRKAGADVVIIEDTDKSSEELLNLVSSGKIRYAIVDESLSEIIGKTYTNINAELNITGFIQHSWGLKHSSDSLLLIMNEWMTSMKKNGKLNTIYARYYNNQKIAELFRRDYFSVTGDKLSPYDQQIKAYSKMIFWDWRLLASLVYEESNFRTGQVSSRNAYGLMQLMPETANILGVDTTSSPSQQLLAGVKYIKWLDKQLPEEITDQQERIHFILASYNVGLGKVLAARKLAQKYGKDPNKWDGNVDYYLTNKWRKNPTPDDDTPEDISPYGMAGGFVAKILERYQHYRNNIPE